MNIPKEILKQFDLEPKETKEYTREEICKMCEEATRENPLFMKINYFHTQYNKNTDSYENRCSELQVACEGIKFTTIEMSRYYSRVSEEAIFVVLNDSEDNFFHKGSIVRAAIMPEYDDDRRFDTLEVFEKTDELLKLRDSSFENIEWSIGGEIYPLYDIDNPNYIETFSVNPIIKKEHLVKGLRDLEECEAWLLNNHPEEFLGHSITNGKGTFSLGASLYGISNDMGFGDAWKNYEGQRKIIEKIAQNYRKKGYNLPNPLLFDYKSANLINEELEQKHLLKPLSYFHCYSYLKSSILNKNEFDKKIEAREIIENIDNFFIAKAYNYAFNKSNGLERFKDMIECEYVGDNGERNKAYNNLKYLEIICKRDKCSIEDKINEYFDKGIKLRESIENIYKEQNTKTNEQIDVKRSTKEDLQKYISKTKTKLKGE